MTTTITRDPPRNDMGWAVDVFRDAADNPPAPADNENLRGYRMRPEAADAFRAWFTAQGYLVEALDAILAEDPVSADAFLARVNAAIKRARSLRYATGGR